MPLVYESDKSKYKSANLLHMFHKMNGSTIYIWRRQKDYEKFGSALENANLNDFIDENRQTLEAMNLSAKVENNIRIGGCFSDENIKTTEQPIEINAAWMSNILTFIKESQGNLCSILV